MRALLSSFFALTAAIALVAAASPEKSERPLSQEVFAATLGGDLSAHFNLEGELRLEFLRPWISPDRSAREWLVQIMEFPSVPTTSMLLRCRIYADGESVGEQTLMVRASLWRDAWMARQPLAHNAAFDVSLLETRRVDMFRDRDALPAVVGDRSYIFVRSVQAGRLLTWRDVARRPLVRKGEVVEVSASAGQLIVTMKGLAMQNGAHGEVVTIRNLDSRKDFSAFVIDENHVQVRF
ncbi:MAG: flagellar basal body P-ring formation chaperone FlgA [Candidatus Didemnitutus sp.]|nr:flagellar basal body P-ring formation chaperone FlgA [Candidatus Didemnitutus sp.]